MKLPLSVRFRNKLTPARTILLGFLCAIIIGALLLSLPISHNGAQNISLLDALFTSTSAVCVTGLVVKDTATTWSGFGQGVILFLIQIGGLGIMFLFSIFALVTKKQINLKERITMQESINNSSLSDTVKSFLQILIATLIFEFIGALILFSEFFPMFGLKESIWKSIFHSVSSFCNAGFDILSTQNYTFKSLISLSNNSTILLTLSTLIVIGGLGFVVWKDIWENKFAFRKYSLHTKIVLITSAILILLGAIMFLALENNNSLGNMPLSSKITNSIFNSISPRTAGFASIDPVFLKDETNFLTMLLMIIGGAPGSTAGGIKVTTFSIIILSAIFFMRGHEDIQIFKNNIPRQIIFKSTCIFMLALLLITTGTFVLLIDNPNLPFLNALYEVTSAFGTVGLSTGITPMLNITSKIFLMLMMLLGRLGPLTAVIAFSQRQLIKKDTYKYSDGKISVG